MDPTIAGARSDKTFVFLGNQNSTDEAIASNEGIISNNSNFKSANKFLKHQIGAPN